MLAVQNKNSNVSAISAIPPIPLNLLSPVKQCLLGNKTGFFAHMGTSAYSRRPLQQINLSSLMNNS